MRREISRLLERRVHAVTVPLDEFYGLAGRARGLGEILEDKLRLGKL